MNTALFAHWTQVVGETAALLGRSAEAENYAWTAREVGDALQQKLYSARPPLSPGPNPLSNRFRCPGRKSELLAIEFP